MTLEYDEHVNVWRLKGDEVLTEVWAWLYQNCPPGMYEIYREGYNVVSLHFKDPSYNMAFKIGFSIDD